MRWLPLVLFACSAREPRHPPPAPAVAAPGLRLPDGVTPLSYELRLEIDPDAEAFHGTVRIRTRLDAPADHIWIHADELDIASASYDAGPDLGRAGSTAEGHCGSIAGPLALLPTTGEQMRAFSFGRTLSPRDVTLAFEFTGHTSHDQEGLFRQRDRGRWYLFSQAESVLARRITPCFDEPRFKTPWQVTLVVPHDQVALANASPLHETALADGRREIAFAPTPPMPSYLLAVAVGPFQLVDAGTVGRDKLPVRVAALRGDADLVGVVAEQLPPVVAEVESYTGDALPWPKLDLVAVPHLFGAMENAGLVTFDAAALVGTPKWLAPHFVRLAAHEIVHQWFGNLVTPAWWDDLWLAESFASWLGDKVASQLGMLPDPMLEAALARERALAADAAPDAKPMRPRIERTADPDAAFTAIAYEKGQLVLAMLERSLGDAGFRALLREYLKTHAHATATTADLVARLGTLGPVLDEYAAQPGVPVVELAARCDAAPAIVVRVRGGRTVPVCVRTVAGRTCEVVRDHAELPQRACPAWLVGNDGGLGYYDVLAAAAPLAQLSPAEKIARGDDVADALARGDVSLPDALAELTRLARSRDGYAQHGALEIARVIDPIVDDRTRWGAWLAERFADRLSSAAIADPRSPLERELRGELAELGVPVAAPAAREAAARLARDPDSDLVAFASPDRATFQRLARLSESATDRDVREAALAALGSFDGSFAGDAVGAFLDSTSPPDIAWLAVSGYFARAATRTAVWHAVHAHLADVIAHMSPLHLPLVLDDVATLCDPASRAEVAAAFAHDADGALAAIDRCIARKRRLGPPQL